MHEIYGNAWDLLKDFDGICILTNGIVKPNGEAVMGAGIAKEASKRMPGMSKELGRLISIFGNTLFKVGSTKNNTSVFSFPTKQHWKDKSDIELIKVSCQKLVEYLDDNPEIKKVLLPRPGTGMGGLDWKYVKKEIEKILDDRVYIVSFKEGE